MHWFVGPWCSVDRLRLETPETSQVGRFWVEVGSKLGRSWVEVGTSDPSRTPIPHDLVCRSAMSQGPTNQCIVNREAPADALVCGPLVLSRSTSSRDARTSQVGRFWVEVGSKSDLRPLPDPHNPRLSLSICDVPGAHKPVHRETRSASRCTGLWAPGAQSIDLATRRPKRPKLADFGSKLGRGWVEVGTSDLRPPTSDLRPQTSDLRPPTLVQNVAAGVEIKHPRFFAAPAAASATVSAACPSDACPDIRDASAARCQVSPAKT